MSVTVKDIVELGDVVETVMGQAPPGDACNREGVGKVFVKAGEFQSRFPLVREWTTKPLKLAKPGDTLVCVVGATAGKVNLSHLECAIGRSVAAVRALPEKLDSLYLFHFLRTMVDKLRAGSQGAAQGVITREMLASLPLPLPPLPEQRRIAAILDQADALRAKRREALAELDSLTQSIFIEMFVSENSRNEQLVRVPLDKAFWFQEGPGVRKWQFTNSGVKLLNVGNIEKDGSINLSKTDRHISLDEASGKYKHFLVDAGDLVIASSGISFDADGLLRTRGGFIRQDQLPLCMNTSTIRFKPKGSHSSLHYLRIWLDSIEFRSQITRLVTGSAQQNFGPSHLAQLEITLPTLSQQRTFLQRVDAIERLKLANKAALMDCDELFASLQHRAFAGEL